MSKLKISFFQEETTKIAVALLGCVLNRVTKNGQHLKGRIVETEAYLGLKDDCCHSFGGKKTERVKVMYQPGGCAYIYFTYGMYYCFNIVTAHFGEPEAVLIRAIEPLTSLDVLQKNRALSQKILSRPSGIFNLTNGPGKLCQALRINKKLNGERMDGDKLYVEIGKSPAEKNIATGPRVGLSPYRNASYWPLRFYIKDNPFVSKPN